MPIASVVTEAAPTSVDPVFKHSESDRAAASVHQLAALLPSLTDMIFVVCLAAIVHMGNYVVSADGDAARRRGHLG